jgi:hypothetical protein
VLTGREPAARPGPGRAETGYTDQAHLIREFRQFTGTTPSGFQRQVNSVLDAAAAAS